MIDLNLLEPSKTYVGWQIGYGFFSSLIQKLSKKETDLPKQQIASHVFMMLWDGDWYVVEAHEKWGGVKKLLYSDWIKDYKSDRVFCAECPLDLDSVQYYVDFNPGYSLAQIAKDAINAVTEKHLWNDSPGVVCSELFAKCENNYKCCYNYNLATYLIKPVHVQMKYINNVIT